VYLDAVVAQVRAAIARLVLTALCTGTTATCASCGV
jgi:hypothetical protein